MSQAEHVLNMLNQITTGLHDKELEYAAAISQSCTFMANTAERDAAKAAMDILYDIQRVLHMWRELIRQLTGDAATPGSHASKMLPASAELLNLTYSDLPLSELLAHIESFHGTHSVKLPEPPAAEEAAAPVTETVRLRSIETGEMTTLTMPKLLEMLEILAPDRDLPPSMENWQQLLEEQGTWELLSEDDYEDAVAQADRTH